MLVFLIVILVFNFLKFPLFLLDILCTFLNMFYAFTPDYRCVMRFSKLTFPPSPCVLVSITHFGTGGGWLIGVFLVSVQALRSQKKVSTSAQNLAHAEQMTCEQHPQTDVLKGHLKHSVNMHTIGVISLELKVKSAILIEYTFCQIQ